MALVFPHFIYHRLFSIWIFGFSPIEPNSPRMIYFRRNVSNLGGFSVLILVYYTFHCLFPQMKSPVEEEKEVPGIDKKDDSDEFNERLRKELVNRDGNK